MRRESGLTFGNSTESRKHTGSTSKMVELSTLENPVEPTREVRKEWQDKGSMRV